MRYYVNQILAAAGYIPVGALTRVFNKPRSTYHRLVKAGRVVGAKDSNALYISGQSLADYYTATGAEPVAKVVIELMSRLQSQAQLAMGAPDLTTNTAQHRVQRNAVSKIDENLRAIPARGKAKNNAIPRKRLRNPSDTLHPSSANPSKP